MKHHRFVINNQSPIEFLTSFQYFIISGAFKHELLDHITTKYNIVVFFFYKSRLKSKLNDCTLSSAPQTPFSATPALLLSHWLFLGTFLAILCFFFIRKYLCSLRNPITWSRRNIICGPQCDNYHFKVLCKSPDTPWNIIFRLGVITLSFLSFSNFCSTFHVLRVL